MFVHRCPPENLGVTLPTAARRPGRQLCPLPDSKRQSGLHLRRCPIADGALKYVGKLGVDIFHGMRFGARRAAILCAHPVLAVLKSPAAATWPGGAMPEGHGGFVNAAPRIYPAAGSRQQRASDLFAAEFGRCRQACRAAVGVGSRRAAGGWKWTPFSRSSDSKTSPAPRKSARGAGTPWPIRGVGRAASLHDL